MSTLYASAYPHTVTSRNSASVLCCPSRESAYYEVPAEYHVTGYRYTYVNEHPVLVEPRTRRVVQIID